MLLQGVTDRALRMPSMSVCVSWADMHSQACLLPVPNAASYCCEPTSLSQLRAHHWVGYEVLHTFDVPLFLMECRTNDFAATGISETCTSQEVMTLDPNTSLGPAFGATMMGAAVVTYNSTAYNGTRQELVTTFDCGSWKPTCLVFGHYALSWLMHDIIPGQRRALFGIQVDDLLVSTGRQSCTRKLAASCLLHSLSKAPPTTQQRLCVMSTAGVVAACCCLSHSIQCFHHVTQEHSFCIHQLPLHACNNLSRRPCHGVSSIVHLLWATTAFTGS
jgi:hypothetical protein